MTAILNPTLVKYDYDVAVFFPAFLQRYILRVDKFVIFWFGWNKYFKVRNFRWKKLSRFRGFWPISRKFLPQNFSKSLNRESLFREIVKSLNRESFFSFLQVLLKLT